MQGKRCPRLGISLESRQGGLCWGFSGRSCAEAQDGVGSHSTRELEASRKGCGHVIKQELTGWGEDRVKLWGGGKGKSRGAEQAWGCS